MFARRSLKRHITGFDVVNSILLALLCFLTVYPFWHQLIVSTSTTEAYYSDWFHIISTSLTLQPYRFALSNPQVPRSFVISILVTVCGTAGGLFLCMVAAYFLSKSYLRLRNLIFFLFILTHFIQGGLIPFYYVVTSLGMRNTYLALFVPYFMEVYYIILMKNYFQNMDPSLEESARLDGASEMQVLFRIVAPTAKPILAAIGLFLAVRFWNDWLPGTIFLSDNRMYPMALYVRSIIMDVARTTEAMLSDIYELAVPATVRAAVIIIMTVPIIMVYPFLQRHFVQGIMLGATKD
jgi:putative aldouronate transport system permease protein